jgi:hypothetical protein
MVIASILVAFALDATWDRAQGHRDLDQDLASVADELNENRAALAAQVLLVERISNSLANLLNAMEASPAEAYVSVPDTTVWISQRTPTFDPSFGAIEALIAAGRLATIERADLRRHLAGLADRASDAGEELLEAQQIYQLLEAPMLYPSFEMREVRSVAERSTPAWESNPIEGGRLVDFPNGMGLRSAMEQRRGLYEIALGELAGLAEVFRQVEMEIASR